MQMGKGIDKLFANQVIKEGNKNKHASALGKLNLRAACPKGKEKFKFF